MATFSTVFPPQQYGADPVVLLDGGMGTTLQAPPFELALDSALWSSELLASEEGRKQLTKLHNAWIEAGADVVETCTYQSSLPLFLPPSSTSYTDDDLSSSLSTMTAALPVAVSSCSHSTPSSSSSANNKQKPVVALSLGPYGSSLQPGQEYGGLYPAPFGPADATYTSPSKAACPSSALEAAPLPLDLVRLPSQPQPEHEAHLAAWHLRRLLDFSTSPNFDDSSLALLAFETVPVLSEARAIRRAVSAFNAHPSRQGKEEKAWYISFVFPRVNSDAKEETVRFPDPAEEVSSLPSLAAQVEAIVAASFGDLGEGYATPGGIGFNCTSPLHAKSVVEALSSALAGLPSSPSPKPWLFFYPDGGATYDVRTRSWHTPEGLTNDKWAVLVADAAQAGRERGVWGGVAVGGCCKAGPGAIEALGKEMRARGWRE